MQVEIRQYMQQDAQAAAADDCLNLDGFEDTEHRCGFLKSDIPLPAWVIADRTQDKTAVQYWKYSIRSDYSTQLTQDTIAYRRLTPLEHPQNNDIAAYEVWSSTLSGCSEAAGDAMLHLERFSQPSPPLDG